MNRWALLSLAGLLAAVPAQGQNLDQQVDSLFSWTSPDAPGCVVAAEKGGEKVIERAYGLADVEGKVLQFSSSDEDALTLVLRQSALTFPPGEEWAYSNGNYLLAKVLVERVSGESFNEFAQALMFGPLGMTSTMYGGDVRVAENHAKAYVPGGTGGARR